ncbi:MAG: glutathione S-transferase family protein [Gaiella sp.]
MGLVLYDNPVSSNALKARFCLAELDLSAERVTIPFALPRPDTYLALNPLGGIPTLVDGDVVVAESNAILRYLARREGRDDLYPVDPAGAARVDTFLDRWSLTFRPAFFRHEAEALGFVPGKGMGGGPANPERAAEIAVEIAPTLALLESLLDGSATALGGSFTIADVAAAPILFRTTKTGLDLGACPRMVAWRDALLSRPAFAAADPVM